MRSRSPSSRTKGGVRRHLLPFEHEVLNNHLAQRGALLRAHPHRRCLRCDVHRTIDGDPSELLNALGQHIRVLEFQRGVGFKVGLEAWGKQGYRHIGMLLVLEIARHFGRPQPV